ncbi:transposase [Rhizobium leguminosarum]|uniref:transposase n=1 Tax=Rhizobium leguminosarum TaxID=384 RepID=UPI0021BBC0B0|nr:transposase [Rhizobium leguminosarum]
MAVAISFLVYRAELGASAGPGDGCAPFAWQANCEACLRITGRAEASNFAAYHQLLNRARWNPRLLAARLLSIIVARFVPVGPVVIGMDDTIERRWRRCRNGRSYRKGRARR